MQKVRHANYPINCRRSRRLSWNGSQTFHSFNFMVNYRPSLLALSTVWLKLHNFYFSIFSFCFSCFVNILFYFYSHSYHFLCATTILLPLLLLFHKCRKMHPQINLPIPTQFQLFNKLFIVVINFVLSSIQSFSHPLASFAFFQWKSFFEENPNPNRILFGKKVKAQIRLYGHKKLCFGHFAAASCHFSVFGYIFFFLFFFVHYAGCQIKFDLQLPNS